MRAATNTAQDTMTEQERMQEGRRMFQIFAARMFEQRVLSAYREKVASERQQKLLEELEEEVGMDAAREAKKAKDAEKRKQKKQQQKQKQAEDKAKKEADKAEKEAAAKAEQEKKQEELKKRKEEQRVKKEEQRKAQEVEQARKIADRLKRQKEEQDRRLETERKAREQKEAERKTREERLKKERDEREARERELKDKKAKTELERKEKEAREKVEQERTRKESQTSHQASAVQQATQAAKRAAAPAVVPIPLSLTKQPSNISSPSPYIQAAVPKAPTPVRPRQGSQQASSKDQSPKTPAALASQVKTGSPGVLGGPTQSSQNVPLAPKAILSRPPSQPPHNAQHLPSMMSPMGVAPPPGMSLPQGGVFGMSPGMNGFHPSQPPMMSGIGPRTQMAPGLFSPSQQMGTPFPRQFGPPNGMPGPPPGMGTPGMPPFGRGLPDVPAGFGNQLPPFGGYVDTMSARTVPGSQHSRQQSGSSGSVEQQAPIGAASSQPIRPPAPIQRPSSVKPHDQMRGKNQEVDDLANHLGSSALLDDDESPEPDYADRRPSMPPGLGQNHGGGFGGPPGFPNRANPPRMDGFGSANNTWGTPGSIGIPFGTPSIPGSSGWGGSPTSGWPSNNAFGLGLDGRPPGMPSPARHQSIRIGMVEAYKAMVITGKVAMDSFVEAKAIFNQLSTLRVVPPVSEGDMRDLLDTEGTPTNGGGSFQVRRIGEPTASSALNVLVKWVADDGRHIVGGGDIGGQIGSPVVGPIHIGSANTTPFGSLRGFPGLAGGGLSGLGQGL